MSAAEINRVELLALNVRPVMVAMSQTVPFTPVIVNVPEPRLIVRVPVPDPEKVLIVILGLLVAKSNVPVKFPVPVKVIPEIVLVPPIEEATVTTAAPEPPSNIAISAVPGIADPPAPPDVVDHLVPAVASHVAVPPTQNLLAMA